jgi:hypothetical protein
VHKIEFNELFLKEMGDMEDEKNRLLLLLRRGRNVYSIAQQLGLLEIRTNELERIYLLLKGWF